MRKSGVAWITGHKGFIGYNLLSSIIDDYKLIGCIGRGNLKTESFTKSPKVKKINGEINSENLISLKQITKEPDVIFHLAGCSSVFKAENNIINTSTESIFAITSLLEFCRLNSNKTLVIIVSSPAVFGQNKKVRNMKSGENPVSIYGLQKSFVEQISNYYYYNYSLKIKIARVYSCYGNGLKKQFLWDFCNKLISGEKANLWGSGEEIRDFIHIYDVIQALRLFVNSKNVFRYIDIGNGVKIKMKDLSVLIFKSMNLYNDGKISDYEFSGKKSNGNPTALYANTKVLLKIGYKQNIPIEKGVKDYCKWFSEINN